MREWLVGCLTASQGFPTTTAFTRVHLQHFIYFCTPPGAQYKKASANWDESKGEPLRLLGLEHVVYAGRLRNQPQGEQCCLQASN